MERTDADALAWHDKASLHGAITNRADRGQRPASRRHRLVVAQAVRPSVREQLDIPEGLCDAGARSCLRGLRRAVAWERRAAGEGEAQGFTHELPPFHRR